MRLEQEMWEALQEICRREEMTVHEVCSLIDERRGISSLTAAMRVFILMYYRSAATDEGHLTAGHGQSLSPYMSERLSALNAVSAGQKAN